MAEDGVGSGLESCLPFSFHRPLNTATASNDSILFNFLIFLSQQEVLGQSRDSSDCTAAALFQEFQDFLQSENEIDPPPSTASHPKKSSEEYEDVLRDFTHAGAQLKKLLNAGQDVLTNCQKICEKSKSGIQTIKSLQVKIEEVHGRQYCHSQELQRLESYLQPFMVNDDPLFRKLRTVGMTDALIEIIKKNNFVDVERLMAEVDKASFQLQRVVHPEAQVFEQIYSSFRLELCVQLKSLISRTFEQVVSNIRLQLNQFHNHLKALEIKRQRINAILTAAGQPKETESESFLPVRWLYVKFKQMSQSVSLVTSFLENRNRANPQIAIYSEILLQIHAVYASTRWGILCPSFELQVNRLLQSHGELRSCLYQAASYWFSICQYEIEMNQAFFPNAGRTQIRSSVEAILKTLGDVFYDVCRAQIVRLTTLEELREIHECLSVDICEVHKARIESSSNETLMAQKVKLLELEPIERIKRDVQEKLLFTLQEYIAAMHEDDEEQGANNRRRALNYPSVLMEEENFSERARIHFPIVEKTIYCLSKIRSTLDSTVLRTLSQEIIQQTLRSIEQAVREIDASHEEDHIHAFLFAVRECEHLQRSLDSYKFRYDRRSTQSDSDLSDPSPKILSFSRFKKSVTDAFQSIGIGSRSELSQESRQRNSSATLQDASPQTVTIEEASRSLTRMSNILSFVTPDITLDYALMNSHTLLTNKYEEWVEALITIAATETIKPLFLDDEGTDDAFKTSVFARALTEVFLRYLSLVGLYIASVENSIQNITIPDLETFPPSSSAFVQSDETPDPNGLILETLGLTPKAIISETYRVYCQSRRDAPDPENVEAILASLYSQWRFNISREQRNGHA